MHLEGAVCMMIFSKLNVNFLQSPVLPDVHASGPETRRD